MTYHICVYSIIYGQLRPLFTAGFCYKLSYMEGKFNENDFVVRDKKDKIVRCPSCLSSENIIKYYSLAFTLDNHLMIIIYFLIVGLVGYSLNMSVERCFPFAILSVLPLIAKVSHKKCCISCGTEIDTIERKT